MDILKARQELILGKTIYDMNLRVADYGRVSTDKDDQLNSLENQTNYFNEMISLNLSLFNLYKNGIISKENAIYFSDNKIELQQYMRGAFHGTSFDV